MKEIKVRYHAVDGYYKTRRFKTLQGARKFATEYIGGTPEIGPGYAVSQDGVGRITVSGCTLHTLFFAGDPMYDEKYQAWVEYPGQAAQLVGVTETYTEAHELLEGPQPPWYRNAKHWIVEPLAIRNGVWEVWENWPRYGSRDEITGWVNLLVRRFTTEKAAKAFIEKEVNECPDMFLEIRIKKHDHDYTDLLPACSMCGELKPAATVEQHIPF